MSHMENYRPGQRAIANVAALQAAAAAKSSQAALNSRQPDDLKADPSLSPRDVSQIARQQENTSFADFLDIINPLQHIPVISSLYQAITGDEISPQAKFAGDALYMGPIGAAVSMVNLAIKETTGNDLGGHLTSMIFDEDEDLIQPVLAENEEQPHQDNAETAEAVPQTDQVRLDPNAVFTFPDAPAAALNAAANQQTLGTNPLASFNTSQEPVALESLPADILAALYSGQTLSPVNSLQDSALGESPHNDLWGNFWDQSESPDASTPANLVPQALFPKALSSYQSSANLNTPSNQPFMSLVQ